MKQGQILLWCLGVAGSAAIPFCMPGSAGERYFLFPAAAVLAFMSIPASAAKEKARALNKPSLEIQLAFFVAVIPRMLVVLLVSGISLAIVLPHREGSASDRSLKTPALKTPAPTTEKTTPTP